MRKEPQGVLTRPGSFYAHYLSLLKTVPLISDCLLVSHPQAWPTGPFKLYCLPLQFPDVCYAVDSWQYLPDTVCVHLTDVFLCEIILKLEGALIVLLSYQHTDICLILKCRMRFYPVLDDDLILFLAHEWKSCQFVVSVALDGFYNYATNS